MMTHTQPISRTTKARGHFLTESCAFPVRQLGLRILSVWTGMTRLFTALIFWAYLLAPVTWAQAQPDEIPWATADFPPFMILEGPETGNGLFDILSATIQSDLSDYTHNNINMQNSRFMHEVADGKNICKAFFFKTPEREKLLHYSLPTAVLLTNSIIMRRDTYQSLGEPRTLHLADIMADTRLRGGFILNRSYAPDLDPIIAAHRNDAHLVFMATNNTPFFRMMTQGKLDYIVDFPVATEYWPHALGQPEDLLVSVPIASSIRYTVTYAVCTRNQWGATVIDRINAVLRRELPTQRYLDLLTRWHGAASRKELTKIHTEFLLEAAAAR